MSSTNHPDKVSLDAFSDPQLQSQNGNGVYSRFTNVLSTPILNAKGIQLLNANFINSRLQLDDNSQLMFWYYTNTSGTIQLRCIRLLPSNYVPFNFFTNFSRNRYFNSVDELVIALNVAAGANGDTNIMNPFFTGGQITFSYDASQRKISMVTSNTSVSVGPAAADDPAVLAAMRTNTIVMNSFSGLVPQPNVVGLTMNARLGYARSFFSRPLWFSAGGTQQIVSSSTGRFEVVPIEGDCNPILIGTQNVGIYCSVIAGSGMDFTRRKNLLETIPVQVAPLNINNYTLTSVKNYAMSVPNEIYEITIELLDDRGLPFLQPPSYNTQISLAILY